jgi:hypothetical protein
MIKSRLLLSILLSSMVAPLCSNEFYEEKKVSHVEVIVDCAGENSVDALR